MTASEIYTEQNHLYNRSLSLGEAVRVYTLQLREKTMQYIDNCRVAERLGEELDSFPYRHISQIYSSAPAELHTEFAAILCETDRLRAEAVDILAPKDLLEFFNSLDNLTDTCSKTAKLLSQLCDDILPRYLTRLEKAAEAGNKRAYTYDIPTSLITELERII